MTTIDIHPMTVSQVLGAHAAAQIAHAHESGAARAVQPPVKPAAGAADSFTVSWARVSMCIGWTRPG